MFNALVNIKLVEVRLNVILVFIRICKLVNNAQKLVKVVIQIPYAQIVLMDILKMAQINVSNVISLVKLVKQILQLV